MAGVTELVCERGAYGGVYCGRVGPAKAHSLRASVQLSQSKREPDCDALMVLKSSNYSMESWRGQRKMQNVPESASEDAVSDPARRADFVLARTQMRQYVA